VSKGARINGVGVGDGDGDLWAGVGRCGPVWGAGAARVEGRARLKSARPSGDEDPIVSASSRCCADRKFAGADILLKA
jgi:hypothetical protein